MCQLQHISDQFLVSYANKGKQSETFRQSPLLLLQLAADYDEIEPS